MEAAKSKSSNNFLTILKKIFSDRILQITVVITIISLFFARPRSADMNWHTIESVTTMLVLIQVYSYLHVLDIIAYKLTAIADSTRKLILLFTLLSVFSGMFLGNDITCLPRCWPPSRSKWLAGFPAACTSWRCSSTGESWSSR